jgi:drug/metabolite transporter (DMT)-like permease
VRADRAIHAALVAVVLMWGLVFVAIARLLPYLDAAQVVVIRFSLISIVFVALIASRRERWPHMRGWREWGYFAVLGLCAVPGAQLTIVKAQDYLSPPVVSLVVATGPAFTAVIAAVWLRERVIARQVVGFLVALAGVAVVIVAGSGASTLSLTSPWAALLPVTSQLSWAVYTVMTKRLTGRYHPITAIGVALAVGTSLMFPLFPHAVSGLGELTPAGWAWMAFLVLGGTVIPYVVWSWALGRLTAGTTSAYMYGIPLAALFWSWLVLDIVPSAVALLGGAVIIAGVSMIQFSRTTRPVEPAV